MECKLLQEKTIVVSGGTKGIGKDLAVSCAKEGANVVIAGRDTKSAEDIICKIQDFGGKCSFVYTDLNQVVDCRKMFDVAIEKYGQVDGFVNYAGVTHESGLMECDEKTYDDIFDIDMKAAFFCCQSAISYMKNKGGSIVLVGSTHAWRGQKDRAAYACAKGALLTLSEHISYHYAEDNIRCNYLVMGWTPTEGELRLREKQGISEIELREQAEKVIPLGRMTESKDVCPGIIYLLSDLSSMVTGTTMRINGGEHI